MPRWKYVVEPGADDGREPDHGHAAVGGSHRLPRLLARAAADDSVPAQLGRLLVRLRGAHAGRLTSACASRRCPPADATSTTRPRSGFRSGDRLRPEDAAGSRCGCAPPARILPARKFKSARREDRRSEAGGHRRARRHLRAAASTPPGSATWRRIALAAPFLGPGRVARRRLRRRAQLSAAGAARDASAWTSTPRRSRASSARPWSRTCVDTPFADGAFDGVVAVHSIEHVPDPERARRARSRACSKPGGVGGARHAQPADVRAARRDHRPLPLGRDTTRPSSARPWHGAFAEVEMLGHVRLRALRRVRGPRARERSTACSRSTACGCAAACRTGPCARLYDTALRAARLRRSDPRGRRDHRRRLLRRPRRPRQGLDLIAVCRSPRR